MKKKGGNEIAFRPQNIIEARFNLSRRQNDVLDLLFGLVGSDGDSKENTRYTITISNVKGLYNIKDRSNAYKYLIDGVKEFKKGGIGGFQLKIDDDTDIWYAWFTRIVYHKAENEDNSRIEIDIHPDLKKMIIEAKQGTFYRIEYSINLKSKYSKRLYYYLKDHVTYQQYEDATKGIFKINVSELMKMLQCPKTYKYGNLKQTVLDKAHEEINGNTDISFEYNEIQGKSAKGQLTVVAIEFKVSSAPVKIDIVDEEISATSEEVNKILQMFGCSIKEAESLYNTALKNNRSWDEAIEILEYTIKQKTDNKVGYALSLLKKGFSKPQATKSNKKINSFHNFESRNYTKEQMADFEKRLLSKNF